MGKLAVKNPEESTKHGDITCEKHQSEVTSNDSKNLFRMIPQPYVCSTPTSSENELVLEDNYLVDLKIDTT